MSKFANWAGRQNRTSFSKIIQRGPQPNPNAVLHQTQPPVQQQVAPIISQPTPMRSFTAPPRTQWVAPAARVQTCRIVRPDGAFDGYSDLLARATELHPQRLAQPGFDAMALPGRPDKAPMVKWTPTARRTYGAADASGLPDVDQAIGQYGGFDKT